MSTNNMDLTEANNKTQARFENRSIRSASPSVFAEGVSEEEMNDTRSQSVESTGFDASDSKKRRRKATNKSNNSNKRQANTNIDTLKQEENDRELRNSPQRISKEARDAKKAERETVIKEKLDELDRIEKAIKDGSHIKYQKLLSEIEEKKSRMLIVAKMKRSLAEGTIYNLYNSQKECAYSQHHVVTLSVLLLEQEYYVTHSSYTHDEHETDWAPPERPSTISSLTLGLTNEEVERDLILAAQGPHQAQSSSSSPIDTMSSLADPYFENDLKDEISNK
ncbi:hypothetical protein G6F43_008330 [Rhizopus delemar]|nr:hypothetical protein G6F43_008330 [Rhizopus delemar]